VFYSSELYGQKQTAEYFGRFISEKMTSAHNLGIKWVPDNSIVKQFLPLSVNDHLFSSLKAIVLLNSIHEILLEEKETSLE
jgi:hypothetical protein